jgi:hypothetical protein
MGVGRAHMAGQTCWVEVPPVAAGLYFASESVSVTYRPGDGSSEVQLVRVANADQCLTDLEAVLGETIPRPSEVRSGLSAAFDEPVMRALQRERELRFPSARHFGRALRRAALTSGELVDAGDLQRWLMSALDHRHRCRRRAGGFPEQLDEDSVSESSDGTMNAVQEPNEAVALPIERSESRTLNWPRRESGMAVAVVAATLVGLVAGAVLVGSSEPASRANTTFATQALSGASSAAFTVPLRAEPIEGAVLEVRGGDGDVILHATIHELLAAELARRQEAPPAGDEP